MYYIFCRRIQNGVIGEWFPVWEHCSDATYGGEYLRTLVTMERDRLRRVAEGKEANPDGLVREFKITFSA